jgi:small subunit ribosomal protein S6
MQTYETIFILDSLLAPEEIDKLVNRVKEIVESNDGKILTVEKWGKRRLAYEIQKKQYGFYVAVEFEGEGPIPNLLEREYNFNDKILRYLTYRYTKNKMIARKRELETRKDQPVTPEIPEVMPKSTYDDTEITTDTENQEFKNEVDESPESEDLNTEEEKKEAENA